MPSAQYGVSLSAGGVSIQKSVVRSGDGSIGIEATLPAAKAGTLTTRTDDNTGEATLGASHGITDGMIVDVYWSGGVRYGMTVGTVASLVVPIDGGAGDNLPAEDAVITLVQQVSINVSIDGDNLEILGIVAEYTDPNSTAQAHVLFEDAGGDDIAELDLTANSPLIYDIAAGVSNPFTGDPITVAKASNGSSSAAATLKITGVVDATP
jgi:hypothetical protein